MNNSAANKQKGVSGRGQNKGQKPSKRRKMGAEAKKSAACWYAWKAEQERAWRRWSD